MVLSAIYMQRGDFIDLLLIQGSPLYLIVHPEALAPFFDTDHLSHMYLLTFQVFKYFFLIRAFTKDKRSTQRTMAGLMEVAYLGLSTYYVLGA